MPQERDDQVCVVLCTCPDEDTSKILSTGLVEARLAACVNILPRVRSVFRWKGSVEDAAEVLMVIKTQVAHTAALEAWLVENHPYDLPEVLVLPVTGGSRDYLRWVVEETA